MPQQVATYDPAPCHEAQASGPGAPKPTMLTLTTNPPSTMATGRGIFFCNGKHRHKKEAGRAMEWRQTLLRGIGGMVQLHVADSLRQISMAIGCQPLVYTYLLFDTKIK